jgi:hypothetical protein
VVLTVERYRTTRYWAVYEAGELVCVTVYKKGAIAVRDRLEAKRASPPDPRNLGHALGKQ